MQTVVSVHSIKNYQAVSRNLTPCPESEVGPAVGPYSSYTVALSRDRGVCTVWGYSYLAEANSVHGVFGIPPPWG